ncbi:MAG: TrkA family potassium uptake protein [Clostridia bacterium]|nr:TrkA family potassium uptake protein [Clostridia bacterium]MDD4047382.1 TrkA family potassium uptake protein [Clostridia bacterium]
MRKQFAVIGLGRFGTSVAKTLFDLEYDVLVIDKNEQIIESIANDVTHAVQADAMDEDILKSLGIENFDVVIVAIGNDIESNILITVMLKDMGIKCVVAKAQNALHGKVLKKIGADKIVYPEKDMGVRVAHSLASNNVMDYIELQPNFGIIEIKAPLAFAGKSLQEIKLRAAYGINVLAIKSNDSVLVSPGADTKIEKGDILIVISADDSLDKLPK